MKIEHGDFFVLFVQPNIVTGVMLLAQVQSQAPSPCTMPDSTWMDQESMSAELAIVVEPEQEIRPHDAATMP